MVLQQIRRHSDRVHLVDKFLEAFADLKHFRQVRENVFYFHCTNQVRPYPTHDLDFALTLSHRFEHLMFALFLHFLLLLD